MPAPPFKKTMLNNPEKMLIHVPLVDARLWPDLTGLFDHLKAFQEGALFLPVHGVEAASPEAIQWLPLVFQQYAERAGLSFLRLCPDDHDFPAPELETMFIEQLLSLCSQGDPSLNRLAKKLLAPKTATAFETDQAVLLYTKEKLQYYEQWLLLLTRLQLDKPCLVCLERPGQLGDAFGELILYLARNIHVRQQALRKGEWWPNLCFVVIQDGAKDGQALAQLNQPLPYLGRYSVNEMPAETAASLEACGHELDSRFSELAPQAQDVLRYLALINQPLPVSVIDNICGLAPHVGRRIIRQLAQAGWLSYFGRKGKKRLALASGLVTDFVARALSEKEKERMHQRLADALPSDEASAHACAFHLFQARRKAAGLAAVLQALSFYRRRGTQEQALRLLEFLINRCARDIPGEKMPTLRHELADLYTLRGDYDGALALLNKNLRDYRKRHDDAACAKTSMAIGILQLNREEKDKAQDTLSSASSAMVELQDCGHDVFRIQLILARIAMENGHFQDALDMVEKTIAQSKDSGWDAPRRQYLEALSFSRLGSIYNALSNYERAEKAFEAAYRSFKHLPDSLEKGGLCCNLGNFFNNFGKYALSEKYYHRANAIAQAIGAKELQALVSANLCVLTMNQWKLEAAESHIQMSLACAEAVGSERYKQFGEMCLGSLRCRQGRFAESIRIFETGAGHAKATSNHYLLMNHHLQMAYPMMETGQWAGAFEVVDEALRITQKLSWPRGLLEGALIMGQLYARIGLWKEAAAQLKRATQATCSFHGHVEAELAQLTGQVAQGQGYMKKAIRHYKRAARLFRRLSVMGHADRCRLDEVSVYLAMDDLKGAKSVLEAVWEAAMQSPPEKRRVPVWSRAALLSAELALKERRSRKKSHWQQTLYALNEALAQARALGLTPLLWKMLTCQARLHEQLKEKKYAAGSVKEAVQVFAQLFPGLSHEAREALLAGQSALTLKSMAAKYLGKKHDWPAGSAAGHDGAKVLAFAAPTGGRARGADGDSVDHGFFGIVAESAVMQDLFALMKRIAASQLSVVITGESGTGKELVAKALHKLGPRGRRPFVAENCMAIPEQLAESELFGYVQGAFAGANRDHKGRIEAADGGTLFLDDIQGLPLPVQAKFLRAMADGSFRPLGSLETRKSAFRLIATTTCDLRGEVERGCFRADLFYRILGIEIRLPPLRERPEDILYLSDHFLHAFAENGSALPRFTSAAKQAMRHYGWPGNVRELRNEIQRLMLLGISVIDVRDLRIGVSGHAYTLLKRGFVHQYSFPDAQALLEKEYLQQALEECGGVVAKVAKLLGMNRRSVYKMMARLDMDGTDSP